MHTTKYATITIDIKNKKLETANPEKQPIQKHITSLSFMGIYNIFNINFYFKIL